MRAGVFLLAVVLVAAWFLDSPRKKGAPVSSQPLEAERELAGVESQHDFGPGEVRVRFEELQQAVTAPEPETEMDSIDSWFARCAADRELRDLDQLTAVVACISGLADFDLDLAAALYDRLWAEAGGDCDAATSLLAAFRDYLGADAAILAWLPHHSWTGPWRAGGNGSLRFYWDTSPPRTLAEFAAFERQVLKFDFLRDPNAVIHLSFGLRGHESTEMKAGAQQVMDVVLSSGKVTKSELMGNLYLTQLHMGDSPGQAIAHFSDRVPAWSEYLVHDVIQISLDWVGRREGPNLVDLAQGIIQLRRQHRSAFDAGLLRHGQTLQEILGEELAAEVLAATGGH